MQYHALRIKSGMSSRALAEQLKTEYPRINKAVISYAENSELSGVQYTAAAAKTIRGIFGKELTQPKRKDACHIGCWLSQELFELFTACKSAHGMSMKEYLCYLISRDSQEMGIEKAATPQPKE